MKTVEVVPYKYQLNTVTGEKRSIFSAVYAGEPIEVVEKGYTWRVTQSDGTVTHGLCRKPAETYEEALAVAHKQAKFGFEVVV